MVGKRRMLAHLATGGGKTVIFSELPKVLSRKRTLVIAHRGELLTQAQDKLQDAGLSAEIEKAKQKASENCPVVVASIQSLNTNGRLLKFNASEFDLVIIDECHHASAQSYRRVVDHFSSAVVIGFTATPYRSDDADLLEVFTDGVIFSMGTDALTHKGFLVPIQKIEHQVESLDAEHVLQAYKTLASNQKTIIFCHDVGHSIEVANAFNQGDIKACFVHGGMDKEDRAETLKQFSQSKIKVLANCNVLTEGYDEPTVECVILARNTDSRSLYEQMIGRGTRLAPGKTHLKVIELAVAPVFSPRTAARYPSFSAPPRVVFGQARPPLRERLENAFWIVLTLAILIACLIGFGLAVRHCVHELSSTHSAPTKTIAPQKKVIKHGKRIRHANHRRQRLHTVTSSEVGL